MQKQRPFRKRCFANTKASRITIAIVPMEKIAFFKVLPSQVFLQYTIILETRFVRYIMSKTKKTCTYAVGVALYVVLAFCIQFPIFENYYLCLGYVAMAVYCYFFGPGAGAIVGGLGVVIYCLLTNGLRGMPGWALGNIVIGLMVGATCKAVRNIDKIAVQQFIIALTVVTSTAIAMLSIKSGVEYVLYAQPFVVRVAKNVYAFVADTVILIASFPVCLALEPSMFKVFPEIRRRGR
jgi:uncharacterized membrane protein